MAIGRSFAEALQKGLRSMETGLSGLDAVDPPGDGGPDAFRAALSTPRPDRLLIAAQALRAGLTRRGHPRAQRNSTRGSCANSNASSIAERDVAANGLPREAGALRRLKALGFSDKRLAELTGTAAADILHARAALGVTPVYKRIDTCAAEFASKTPYMYSTFEGGYGTPGLRSRPDRPDEGDHPRRRPEPHRPGHRVRLLLRPRRLCAAGCRVRDHHGQLQPGNRQHRLRHLRPAVFRAADGRGRHRADPPRAAERHRAGLHRPVRRPDAAETVAGAGAGGHPDPRHLRRRDRPRGGPRAVPASAATPRPAAARQRHRPVRRRGRGHRRAHRLPGGDPPQLRARRPGDGDRLRPHRPAPLHARGGPRLRRQPGADRPLPERRDRGRCRLHLPTAKPSTSPASWSISRKPASIPATPPARCRRIRCPPP